MGRKLVLTGTKLSDLSAPRLLKVDKIESPGSLMLIDPTHPAGAWAPGNPTNGGTLNNLVSEFAAKTTGFSESQLEVPAYVPSVFSGAAGKLERTARGGLHGIASQTAGATAGGPVLAWPTKLVEYVLRNPRNTYYTSMWFRPTRWATNSYPSQSILAFNGNGQQTNSYLACVGMAYQENLNISWTYRAASGITNRPAPPHTLSPKLVTLNSTGWFSSGVANSLPGDGTNSTVTGSRAGGGIMFGSPVSVPGVSAADYSVASGNFSHAGGVSPTNTLGSFVFYRAYIEDLTVSGRTWDQVNAIDQALYNKEVLTAGGRYYGDTFTDPTTLP